MFRNTKGLTVTAALLSGAAASAGPDTSLRPPQAPSHLEEGARIMTSTANISFERWISGFRRRALAAGIRGDVFDAAFADVRYNADVIQKDRNQSEFTKQIWEYLDSAASTTRVRNGRAALRENRRVLAQIEARYGVEAEIVSAVWGLESAYGTYRGTTPIIGALATLAFDGRRGSFFETQLLSALRIIQAGDVSADKMTGSWAGAMGHTQFIPTSYLAYAVDFTGDGRRDIWSDDPTDALASTAAYLARHGWTKGQPWGVEVRLPQGFDYGLAGDRVKKSPADWAALGVRDMDGGVVPNHGRASILLPAGARGAAFMIFDNFHVIERYNAADAYVIGVGHLADRIAGGPPIQGDWPRGDRPLRFSEKQEMQERLTAAGFDTQGADGVVGPNTIAAIRRFQASQGMVPDGYASFEILRRLR
ncbi:MAG: lytic murein transglycosylase [Rhodobacteraceae bacterium]|nr:lytic murein transglycosylase [Paracoccaceae bacterium]